LHASSICCSRLSRPAAYVALFAGLVLVSTSGPFIVMAHMDAYAVVLLRTAGAALVFTAACAARGRLRFRQAHLGRTVLGALLLCAHFLLWIKAFDLTNYASNLLLLVSQPVVAALLGGVLGEHATKDTWISIVLAIAGLSIIAGGDFALGPRALAGDAMCIGAGLAITLFYVVTREARSAMPIDAFMASVMAVCAVAAAPVVLFARVPVLAYPPRAWAWLCALVVLTTVSGHGLLNLAARHVKLFTVNVIIVLEPAIAIALGALLFGARVTRAQVGGGVLLAVAVVIGLRHERAVVSPPEVAA
jgi:drug/metabolite transporter (DMT)-like permease